MNTNFKLYGLLFRSENSSMFFLCLFAFSILFLTALAASMNDTVLTILAYIICHDDDSEEVAINFAKENDWAKPLRIRTTPFFESIAYREHYPFLVDDYRNVDFVGTLSYRVVTENLAGFHFDAKDMLSLLNVTFQRDYDVVPVLRSRGEKYLAGGVRYHGKHFQQCWDAVLSNLGFNETAIRKEDYGHPFYRNAYFAKPDYFKRISKYMSAAIDEVLLNDKVESIFRKEAYYTGDKGKITAKAFNTNHYEYHPFVFERLPVFFFNTLRAKICIGDDSPCSNNFI